MPSVRGSCLCGEVAWEITSPLEMMSHCHCSRCRKAHGAAFGSYLMCPEGGFRQTRGADRLVRFESSPGFYRPFCGRCGSVTPDGEPFHGIIGIPAGPLDDDPGARPMAHIFVASKAPWFEIHGSLPVFDAYPPGFDGAPPLVPDRPSRDPAGGGVRGSCLCGDVGYVVEGKPFRAWNCHCSRCRKARGAAHASNAFVNVDEVRFTRGEDRLTTYKVPEARFYTQVFCAGCGSPMPRKDRERGFGIIPMGSLDDDPGIRPERHIFTGSKAPWYDIPDALPQDPEYPS